MHDVEFLGDPYPKRPGAIYLHVENVEKGVREVRGICAVIYGGSALLMAMHFVGNFSKTLQTDMSNIAATVVLGYITTAKEVSLLRIILSLMVINL